MGLGLHGGGIGTVRYMAERGARLMVTDLRTKKELAPSLKALFRIKGITWILGRHRKQDFLTADLIVKNPGVPPSSPYLAVARKNKIPITSDIGIFFNTCPCRVVGVTGTRGKSTTAYLIWKFLKTKHKRVFLGGNIRKSVLEFLPHLKKSDLVVLELSSFQLEDLVREKKSPAIAVMTNIYRDHLNWHKNFGNYISAKSNIFKFHKHSDFLFINPDDRILHTVAKKALSKVIQPRLSPSLYTIVDKKLGKHYRSSIGLAVAVAKNFGVGDRAIDKVLAAFKGLEGRQEHVATVQGINFINDTTATSPDAVVAALNRFRPIVGNKKLILIAGGQDKRLDFKKMTQEIKKSVDILILLPGTATEKIKKRMVNGKWQMAYPMKEAVRKAYVVAQKGDYVVFSPGAASFGLFLNEFDRGAQFVKEVKRLK